MVTLKCPCFCGIPNTLGLLPWSQWPLDLTAPRHMPQMITESKILLLNAQQVNKSERRGFGLRQGIRLYSESWITKKMADWCLQINLIIRVWIPGSFIEQRG